MNILQAIGNTPLVELTNLNKNPDVKVLCKLEGCNPGGSVKDRPALFMITRAEGRGELHKDKIILEATSGNTGIAIAMIGAAKGYRVELCMPECVSTERRLILQGLGSEVFLTPAKENIDGAIRGTSSGAAAAVALKIASRIGHGTIVVLLPDRGDRYLSTMQFRSICAKCPP